MSGATARDMTASRIINVQGEALRVVRAVGQISEGLAILDNEGRVLFANPAFAAHHGLSQDDIAGRPIADILRIESEEHRDRLRDALSAGQTWSWNLTRGASGAPVRELILTISPILDAAGRVVDIVAVERDVTREALAEGRLRQWQKMEALGTLAGGIAHDFNNILLPIQINTELMLAGEKAGSPDARRLTQILEATLRGRDMVGQILAFARQKDQDRKPVDIAAVIKESLKLLRISMPKTITVSERIDVKTAYALADPTQIGQVLMNLGSNAAHAMRDRCGILEVGLSEVTLDAAEVLRFIGLKPGAYLCLRVSDSGPGMPPEVVNRIFEPFFTTKKSGEGSGLGLSVVDGIVRSHGGAISVSSAVGEGTDITILLPRITQPAPASLESPGIVPGGNERVLHVDDEIMQSRAMERLLKHLGYRVTAMVDPLEALEIFLYDPGAFDLVILDQAMPLMTGGALAAAIMKARPGMPIIICTGYSEGLSEEQAAALGIKAFIWKPFSLKEMAEAIRRVLQRPA